MKLIRWIFSPVIKIFKYLSRPFLGIYYTLRYEDKRCNTCIYFKSRLITGADSDYCKYNPDRLLKIKNNRSNKVVCRYWSDDIQILRNRFRKEDQ